MASDMTESEFESFLAVANEELRYRQDSLKTQYRIGSFARWWYEQATAKLQFFNQANQIVLEADIIHVGSYSAKSNTWKWGWSNDSVLPCLRQKTETLKELESITGYDLFGSEAAFEVEDESQAWELTAIAVKHLGAIGCYRAPSSEEGGPATFLAITSIQQVGDNAP